jgi:co-chaperonin GroES (HSP10)
MLNFTPLRDIIAVRPDPKITKIGSIWLPDGSTQAGHEPGRDHGSDRDGFIGTVVAVGRGDKLPDGTRLPMLTKVGDRVVYPRRPTMTSGEADVMIDGEMLMLFHEEQSSFAVIEA